MTLELNLPPELERQANDIPDFKRRVALFIEHQVALESWRSQHGSLKARQLVDEALAEGETGLAQGVDREQAFGLLEDIHQSIIRRL